MELKISQDISFELPNFQLKNSYTYNYIKN